jgi:uncharacterized membrane protein YhiD involved in acid resistance
MMMATPLRRLTLTGTSPAPSVGRVLLRVFLAHALVGSTSQNRSKEAFSARALAGLRTSMLVHAAGGLVVLLTALTLATYKPQGITPYGVPGAPTCRPMAEEGF